MSEGLVIFGERGQVLSVNKSAVTFLAEESGKNNFAGESYLMLSRDINYIRAVESALSGNACTVHLSRNGKVYSLSSTPVLESNSKYAAVLFIVDITDRERSDQLRREFSANVSHELKTPLTTIIGYADLMSNGMVNSSDVSDVSKKACLGSKASAVSYRGHHKAFASGRKAASRQLFKNRFVRGVRACRFPAGGGGFGGGCEDGLFGRSLLCFGNRKRAA